MYRLPKSISNLGFQTRYKWMQPSYLSHVVLRIERVGHKTQFVAAY